MKTSFTTIVAFVALLCCHCLAGDIQIRTGKVTGIGHEAGVCLRDVSDIIKVGNRYYAWYSRLTKDRPLYPTGYFASVWYEVSDDGGHTWVEKGEVMPNQPSVDA